MVVGKRDLVAAFRLLGIEGIIVEKSGDLMKTLKNLINTRKEVALILIDSSLASEVRGQIYALKMKTPTPVITEIPAPLEEWRPMDLRMLVRKALGVG